MGGQVLLEKGNLCCLFCRGHCPAPFMCMLGEGIVEGNAACCACQPSLPSR